MSQFFSGEEDSHDLVAGKVPGAADPRFRELDEAARKLKTQIKAGRFDEAERKGAGSVPTLIVQAERLEKQLQSLRTAADTHVLLSEDGGPCRFVYLWALSWTTDALEYCGGTARIRSLIQEEGLSLSRELFGMPQVPPKERKLARQKVWVVLHYAHACFYRQYEYRQALSVIDGCDKFVEYRLRHDKEFPCFYTRARISAYRAAILRQLGDLNKAQRAYEDSLALIHSRLSRESEKAASTPERIAQEEIRAGYEIAKILALGIGWCQLVQGLLHDARVNVLTAMVMLSPTRDVLRKGYAELLMSSIERVEAGFDIGKLNDVIKSLDVPRGGFSKYNHKRYVSRADYELSLAHLYRATALQEKGSTAEAATDFKEAEERIRRVLRFSQEAHDRRWQAVSHIVLSRIARSRIAHLPPSQRASDVKRASDHAKQALVQARELIQDVTLRFDAEIACGEVLMALDNPSPADVAGALQHFEEALSHAQTNPKTLGVAHLHLAEAHLRNNDVRKALDHYDQWTLVRASVGSGVVHRMAARVEQRIDAAKQSWFTASARETLNYEHHNRKLREFLLNQASAQNSQIDAIASSLGIKRSTCYNWLKELRIRKGERLD